MSHFFDLFSDLLSNFTSIFLVRYTLVAVVVLAIFVLVLRLMRSGR